MFDCKSQCRSLCAVCSVYDVLCCDSQHCAVAGNQIKVFALFLYLIGHIFILKAFRILADGKHQLCLQNGAKLLSVIDRITQIVIFHHTHILFVHVCIRIELFILSVRAYQTADKGKDKHNDQHSQANYCQSVSEKPFCNQRARGQHFDTTVVI